MPKKKLQETQEEQSERFNQTVLDLVDAGELDPIEADAALEKVLTIGTKKRPKSNDSSE